MSTPHASRALFNLQKTSILLADADPMGQSILGQLLAGFGARHLVRSSEADDLRKQLGAQAFDLVLIDPASFGAEGYDIIPWFRRTVSPPRAHAPVLVITGHTEHRRVGQLRDAGANFIISKPLSAAVLMERLMWLARESRAFVESSTYVGPDRRWHDAPLPAGVEGRRQRDRDLARRISAGGDMNQEDIDLVMTSPISAVGCS